MENALYDFYSLVELYQKTHSFAALTRSFSDTTQLVNKNFHGIISIFRLENAIQLNSRNQTNFRCVVAKV